mgnify:CR=1 FL=1
MTVLGVGADYGLYTISLAKEMPNQGHTWSFEPTAPSARHLGQSIKELAQITVIKNLNVYLMRMYQWI